MVFLVGFFPNFQPKSRPTFPNLQQIKLKVVRKCAHMPGLGRNPFNELLNAALQGERRRKGQKKRAQKEPTRIAQKN